MSTITLVGTHLNRIAEIQSTAAQQVEAIESQIRPLLNELTKAELLDLAENCGAESGPEHCLYCEAWSLFVAMGDT